MHELSDKQNKSSFCTTDLYISHSNKIHPGTKRNTSVANYTSTCQANIFPLLSLPISSS